VVVSERTGVGGVLDPCRRRLNGGSWQAGGSGNARWPLMAGTGEKDYDAVYRVITFVGRT
jgi:hypothetical protein